MSKYLTEQDARRLVSVIKQYTPVVTGNLKSSVQFIRMTDDGFVVGVGIKKTGMAGSSPANYASFVNYGYLKHPKSKKLKRDYRFVERAVAQWGLEVKRTIDYKIRMSKKEDDDK